MPKIDNKPGVKNADSFNHTLGYKQEYKVTSTDTYNSYDKAVRKASKQADSIVIRVDCECNLSTLSDAINNRTNLRKNIKEIMLIIDGKDATYKREHIIQDGFKIQKEDFK